MLTRSSIHLYQRIAGTFPEYTFFVNASVAGREGMRDISIPTQLIQVVNGATLEWRYLRRVKEPDKG
jgi:hypothetical protein